MRFQKLALYLGIIFAAGTCLAQTTPVSLSSPSLYPSNGWYTESVVVADLNKDGNPDLVAGSECGPPVCMYLGPGSINVLLGTGGGKFGSATSYDLDSGYATPFVKVADVNGDGRLDILATIQDHAYTPHGSAIDVFLGNGDGTFQSPVMYDSGGYRAASVEVFDLNGDFKRDLIVINGQNNGPYPGLLSVLMGNGDGTFQSATSYSTGGEGSTSVALVDINRDGKRDVLVTSSCVYTPNGCPGGLSSTSGALSVLLGNGDGTFQTARIYNVGGYGPNFMDVADLNGDGKLDVVIAAGNSSAVLVLLGKGDGTFQAAVWYGSGGAWPYSIKAVDINGDGRRDLVVANLFADTSQNSQGVVGVLLGNGNGSFQAAVPYATGSYRAMSVAVADVNGDHKPDVVAADLCSDLQCSGPTSNGSLSVLINKSAAIAAFSQPSLNFGSQRVNTTGLAKRVTLFNKGNYQMTVSQFLITGDFIIQTNQCKNGVRPSTHCDLYLAFRPRYTGTRQGRLTVVSNATNNLQSASLTGIGVP